MQNNPSFDETLYKLVESGDTAAGTGALKERIDREPEFRAAFDQTRKTVIALQGLGPKPAPAKEATFTQKDIDKLTRDILKGYRVKFAQVLGDLGFAYSQETPQEGFNHLPSKPIDSSAKSEERLVNAVGSYSALLGTHDSITENVNGILATRSASVSPVKKAISCLSLSRSLRPNNPVMLAREAMVWLRSENAFQARSLSDAALEIARTPKEKASVVSANVVLRIYFNEFEEADSLVQKHLEFYSNDLPANYNRALLRVCLRDTESAADEFGRFLSIFSVTNEHDLPKIFTSTFLVMRKNLPEWIYFRRDKANFSRFVRYVESYLGSEIAVLAESVVI